MKNCVIVILFLFMVQFAFSQNVLRGKVVDINSGLPIPSVSVYINNSTKGVFTNANGQFVLDNISVTNFDIVASCIGYQIFSKAITASDFADTLVIKLVAK